jgi:hypothetical protein
MTVEKNGTNKITSVDAVPGDLAKQCVATGKDTNKVERVTGKDARRIKEDARRTKEDKERTKKNIKEAYGDYQ